MKKPLLLVIVLALIGVAYGAYAYLGPQPNPDPNHTHADFAVWLDGDKLDFSGEQFMSGVSTDETTHPTEGPKRFLHLHDGNGSVIHRHKPGLTLKEFFDSLQVGFDDHCYVSFVPLEDGQICSENPWRLFVNEKEVPFDMNYIFQDMDRILLTTTTDQTELNRQMSDLTADACRYSQTCPWKGKAPTENCIADPEVPCVAS